MPGAIAKRRLGPPFVAELDRALGDRKVGDAPMRLRLVLHCGEVTRDKRGSSGAEVDRAFGMVNNDRVRQMLAAAPRARMVVVVSDEFYRGAFCSDPADDPTWFRCVDLDLKRGRMLAWVGVPGLRHPPVIEPDEPSKTDTVAGSQRDTPSGDVLFINGGVSGGMVGGRQNTNSGTINSGHIVTNSGSSGRG
ncbi:hypothetical protein Pa4123_20590 [Phytohabitans aurantiacus]|uniref:Rhodanese domain-containing protein n=1 Tax=Phytohabitans aurantiacus TaxID=3016789 RepID=A0ABQ5QR75_9ACTN|nr:hypothetical protein Pa4123_20590 [Phytohabitans aurantiacus]